MSTWLDVLNKFLEKTPLFPAGAFAALTIIILREYGFLSDMRDPGSWVAMAGIFCIWLTIFVSCQSLWTRAWAFLSVRFLNFRNRKTEVQKLQILTDKQRYYLVWLKAKDMRHFQAWDNDETIIALRRMRLIRPHEHTDQYYSRYEIPRHVWDNIEDLDVALRQRLAAEPSWERAGSMHLT